jgi:HPt (histidine-containing phosphotransfer) domain-containing protein
VEDALPVLDLDIMAQLDTCMEPEKIASHLATLAADVEALLALLHEGGDPAGTEALEAIAHKVAGDGGQLGFMALSAAARRYEAAWHQDRTQLPKLVGALLDVAGDALEALRQRRDFIRRAAMVSEKLG